MRRFFKNLNMFLKFYKQVDIENKIDTFFKKFNFCNQLQIQLKFQQ